MSNNNAEAFVWDMRWSYVHLDVICCFHTTDQNCGKDLKYKMHLKINAAKQESMTLLAYYMFRYVFSAKYWQCQIVWRIPSCEVMTSSLFLLLSLFARSSEKTDSWAWDHGEIVGVYYYFNAPRCMRERDSGRERKNDIGEEKRLLLYHSAHSTTSLQPDQLDLLRTWLEALKKIHLTDLHTTCSRQDGHRS